MKETAVVRLVVFSDVFALNRLRSGTHPLVRDILFEGEVRSWEQLIDYLRGQRYFLVFFNGSQITQDQAFEMLPRGSQNGRG